MRKVDRGRRVYLPLTTQPIVGVENAARDGLRVIPLKQYATEISLSYSAAHKLVSRKNPDRPRAYKVHGRWFVVIA